MKKLSFFGLLLLAMLQPIAGYALCLSSIVETSPTARFIDNGNGTVTDTRTALMWTRCAFGQTWDGTTCSGTATKHTWQDGLTQAGSAIYAGHSDWRLPNVKELTSIVERRCTDPSINSEIFPNTPTSYFWTNSPLVQGMGTWAHNVSFSGGYDMSDDKAHPNPLFHGHIRLVRPAR